MKLRLTLLALVTSLVAAPSAEAASVDVAPKKACYRTGEKVLFAGMGFTPNSSARITSDGAFIGSLSSNPAGQIAGTLTVRQPSGEKVKTYSATDATNPAIAASKAMKVSALAVTVRPQTGRPGRRLSIRARGFTTARRFYAHVARGRYRRNVALGRLRGDCRTRRTRAAIFARRTRAGRYVVQFDGKRRYSRKTKVKVRYRVSVYRTFRGRGAAGGAAGWTLIR